ncbi:IclR family transcriptional regulator [Nocardioides sp.]|uniref:IclR family transcriptional regulator n=1 Tax=Nocardioides sp. TaxID=35761 RepID=UPI0039E4AE74
MTVTAITSEFDDVADCPESVDSRPPSVLGKAHLLLEAFASGSSTLGLTELSRRSGVPKASAHRLAVELVGLGLLAKTPQGYQLGWRIFELGQLVPGPANLRAIAKPLLMDLRVAIRAVVHLAVPKGAETVYLERFAGQHEIASVNTVGHRVPSHTTASGMIFLAHGTPRALADLPEDALTLLGLRDRTELEERFAGIRGRRFAEEPRQCVPGLKTIAVPVMYPGTDQVIAAVSATMPVGRRDDQRVCHALWTTAGDISRGIAGGPSRRNNRLAS